MPFRRLVFTMLVGIACAIATHGAWAGTTGGIHGRIVDARSGAAIAGAAVTAAAPSQTATVTTDARGFFSFISLSPDTYTVTIAKNGYAPKSLQGITVIADQTRTANADLALAVRTLGNVLVRDQGSLVRPGTTSDVYSINAAGQKASSALAGSGGLNQAYGAIASAPGVVYPQGQQGWYQSVYIRGGDFDQVAYEVDGVPMMRVSDSAPLATLT
ncbi:MAG: carboxypeptidase regulatory-like domain-containing protein, partial [Candidatus Eremiobacteraeota bacterium]|nr:carboxypeptidase regulatory-like domain-containing protein [Candidatus Eremiobacteraeota bacterium]